MSQETSKLRFLSLARKSSINEIIKNFIIQCNDHVKCEIFAKFGEIKGFYSRINVNLPVACDCVLEQSSSDYKFEEKLTRKHQSYLIERIIKANRDSWIIAEDLEMDEFFEERYLDEIVSISRRDSKEIFCELNLGEIVVYRPKSNIHYEISSFSRTPLNSDTKLGVPLNRYKKNVIGWTFQRKAGNMYPYWNLKVINVILSNRIKRKRSESVDLESSKLDFFNFLENSQDKEQNEAEDEEQEFWTIMLTGNKQLISKHVELFKKGLNNGLDRISNELIINSCLISKYLEEAVSMSTLPNSCLLYYYPNYFGDITTSVKAHYNMKKIQHSEQSIIGGLRKYNNEIKRALIDYYFDLQLKIRQNRHLNVLDLACGHGQDILKYRGKRIGRLIGIDISAEEISEARHRLKTYENSLGFSVEYHVGNLLSKSSYSNILKDSIFDIVSIQLSMHYMLVNEQVSAEFLKNVSKHLKTGGYFIGSTISCDQIFYSAKNNSKKVESPELIQESENPTGFEKADNVKYISGNSIYKISFEQEVWNKYFADNINIDEGLQKFRTDWGIKYDFWLIEHINQYEYVVPWDSFCKQAKKLGLELMQYLNFPSFTEFILENFENLRLSSWINNPKHSNLITQQESEVFNLYCIFAFRKVGDSVEDLEIKKQNNVSIEPNNLAAGYKVSKKMR